MTKERYELLGLLGYFEIDDYFWADKRMPIFVGQGFGWAYKCHESNDQKYMPYTEATLIALTDEQLRFKAQENCNKKSVFDSRERILSAVNETLTKKMDFVLTIVASVAVISMLTIVTNVLLLMKL